MLKKENRLNSKSAFKATYCNNNCLSDKYITLWLGKKKTSPSSFTRVGFVVSKKFHKRAVKRNRAKRLFRECVRIYLKDSPNNQFSEFQSVIFSLKSELIGMKFEEVNKIFVNIVNKLSNKNI